MCRLNFVFLNFYWSRSTNDPALSSVCYCGYTDFNSICCTLFSASQTSLLQEGLGIAFETVVQRRNCGTNPCCVSFSNHSVSADFMALQGIPWSLLDCVMLLLGYITQACVTQHGHVYVLLPRRGCCWDTKWRRSFYRCENFPVDFKLWKQNWPAYGKAKTFMTGGILYLLS